MPAFAFPLQLPYQWHSVRSKACLHVGRGVDLPVRVPARELRSQCIPGQLWDGSRQLHVVAEVKSVLQAVAEEVEVRVGAANGLWMWRAGQ